MNQEEIEQEIEDWFDERALSQNQQFRVIGLIDKEELKDRLIKKIEGK